MLQPFYVTFGSDERYPFQNTYLVINAHTRKEAEEIFDEHYPPRTNPLSDVDLLSKVERIHNYADMYSQEEADNCELLTRYYTEAPAIVLDSEIEQEWYLLQENNRLDSYIYMDFPNTFHTPLFSDIQNARLFTKEEILEYQNQYPALKNTKQVFCSKKVAQSILYQKKCLQLQLRNEIKVLQEKLKDAENYFR